MLYIRKRNEKVHDSCRSLLQKAMRRGDAGLVNLVYNHLNNIDARWLSLRTDVLLFEESWILALRKIRSAEQKRSSDTRKQDILDACTAPKAKDAAGAGDLAYLMTEKPDTVIRGLSQYAEPTEWEILDAIVSGMREPDAFFHQLSLTDQAGGPRLHAAFRRAGWPWDKAMIVAAIVLEARYRPNPAGSVKQLNTPREYWGALDKHTSRGKQAIRTVARDLAVSPHALSLCMFYFESAKVDRLYESPFWRLNARVRLARHGLTEHSAASLWRLALPKLRKELHPASQEVFRHVWSGTATMNAIDMPRLFD